MIQFGHELVDGVPESLDLHGQTILRFISTQLHVRSVGSVLEPRLRQLQWVLLGLYGGLHVSNVTLLV